MKLLWMTWKDLTNPLAGGAEVVNEQLAKRLVQDGHEVTLLVGGFAGAPAEEMHPDGYKIIRVGSRYMVYLKAYRYYKKHLKGWADLVIDEVNTVPFFAKFYVREPNILFAHMLCRKIWFYELPAPFSTIGYFMEPVYLWLLSNKPVITVSESTKKDLRAVGFRNKRIHTISEGLEMAPLTKLPPLSSKSKQPTMLSLGAMRSMKRTTDQIKAFEHAKRQIPDLKFNIAGDSSGKYGAKVLRAIEKSQFKQDITYHGRVSLNEKIRLMRESHVICVTSVKEGWGLIVTEANSQGTPAVVYNVDGLRDSVIHGGTGLIAKHNTPLLLANQIVSLLQNDQQYERLRQAAWKWSRTMTFDKSYDDFKKAIDL